jgi:hypothetical protein
VKGLGASGCGWYGDGLTASVRVQAAELRVLESVDDVHQKVSNAVAGVQRAGVRVTASGWGVLTDADKDASDPRREVYIQASQIGYVREG